MTSEEQPDTGGGYRQYAIEEYHPHVEPYYVPTGDEARLVEGMIRLTPGVRDVRNELKFPAPTVTP